MPAVELREEIDPSLLSHLSFNFGSPNEAIFELIDNGLASRLPGAPVGITLTGAGWTTNGELKIITKNGRGMDADDLERLFLRWGKPPETEGLNRYGQGGKAAIGYLGTGFRIRANCHGDDQAYEFEDRDWNNRPGGTKRFLAQPVPAAIPGVGVVEIEILGLRRTISATRLERDLAWRYRPALVAGDLKLRVKRRSLKAAPLEASSKKDFKHRLVVATEDRPDEQTVELRGWVGVAAAKFEGRGGLRCSAHGRVIEQHEYFGHPTAFYKASLNSLVGEVDLSFVAPNLNKTGFDKGSPEWEAARTLIHGEMAPFVEKLLERKDPTEPSEQERFRAMEAKDMAHDALEKLAAESARRGQGGARSGRKPPAPSENGHAKANPKPSQANREPRTPPPPDAVGTLRRSGQALDWDVRGLDPKIRSATSNENGRAEIIINNRFPLYRVRKGDLTYMLETGLLEELKPGEDESKSVPDYYDDVSDAVFQALTMQKHQGH